MNIIILSFLNLDLFDLDEFTHQFITSAVKGNPNQNVPINLYLIDHLAIEDSQVKLLSDGNKLFRISVNRFIGSFGLDAKITTHGLYRDYLAYLARANSPNRKLIENIFYINPALVEFLKLYVFSIIKFASLLESAEIPTHIISCDPIFHQLLAELKTYEPSAVTLFYEQISEKLKLQIWGMPPGIPAILTPPTNCTSRLQIPFIKHPPIVIIPEIIKKFTNDDIYNLDLLSSSNRVANNTDFRGQICNVTCLEDIRTGLSFIFQNQIIDRGVRIPRQHMPTDLQPLQIIITPVLFPAPDKLIVLEDIKHQLAPELISHHRELINRELLFLQPEIDMLSLEWELKIQRQIKFKIQITIQSAK